MQNHKRELERTFDYSNVVKVGDKLENFRMISEYGDVVTLESLLRQGPLVITYIRGDW